MEAERVILVGSKMWMCWVCIREKVGVGGRYLCMCFCPVFLFCLPPFSLAQELHQSMESSLFLYDMTSQGKNLRFISWNLKGANQVVKRNKVMTHLKQLKGDIFFFTGDPPLLLRG